MNSCEGTIGQGGCNKKSLLIVLTGRKKYPSPPPPEPNTHTWSALHSVGDKPSSQHI